MRSWHDGLSPACGAAIALLIAVAAWAFFFQLGAAPLLDDPNDGEYAEVAREMVETGEWLSPHLNYALFLNKPPLAYWGIALADLLCGVNELAARIPSAVAGLVIVLLLARLGTVLFDAQTGVLAGFLLLSTAGFWLETHLVRPDLLLTAGTLGALLCFTHLIQADAAARHSNAAPARQPRWPLLGLQASLALGLLAKGFLALLLPGLVIVVLAVAEGQTRILARLLHPRSWWLFAILVVPWHALMTVRHPGFLWDYVVQQHVLFFFDRKLPRDSEPISLGTFWAAFAFRLSPWVIFAPLAAVAALVRLRRAPNYGDRLALTWAAVVLGFFSATAARLEHYSIPALPACALLGARLFRDYARPAQRSLSQVVRWHAVALGALAMLGPFVVPRVIAGTAWLAPVHEMPGLATRTCLLFAAGAALAGLAALTQRRALVAPLIIATIVLDVPFFDQGLHLVARVNSSAGLAAVIRQVADPEDTAIFEAPVEYQNCAGLNFYLRRRLALVQPRDFVPPAYLGPHMNELFISRERLDELWREQRVFLVTDPLAFRAQLDGTVPRPFYVVARDRLRWAIANHPLH